MNKPATEKGVMTPDDPDMETLVAEAKTVLRECFKNRGKNTSADIATARIAGSLLSTYARLRQASGAADALNFMIARELSENKDELERFLTAAMPGKPIVRSLPPKPS